MIKEKIVYITHYDLDAAGCAIVVNKLFDVVEMKAQGYGKVSAAADFMINKYHDKIDHVVITDLMVDRSDVINLLEAFPKVTYIDHHLQSAELVDLTEKYPGYDYYYNHKLSATALTYKYFIDNGGTPTPALNQLVEYTNSYDLWKCTKPAFKHGCRLNNIFWNLNLWRFIERFEDGYFGLTDDEKTFCSEQEHFIVEVIKEADIEYSNNCALYIIKDPIAINFIPLTDNKADVFFILSKRDDNWSCSTRLRPAAYDKYDLNEIWQKVNHPIIESAGGHKAAAGVTIKDGTDLDDIIGCLDGLIDKGYFNG